MIRKKIVVIGLLGTTLDRGSGRERWNSWRPTVDLCRHDDLVVSRLELLHAKRDRELAATVVADVRSVSPETTVREHLIEFRDPWDFGARLRGALRVRAQLSVRPRPRRLSRARHHRHARRADLPVPADRVAHDSGAAAANGAAETPRRRTRPDRSASSISTCRSTTGSRPASSSSIARTSRSSRPASRRATRRSTI